MWISSKLGRFLPHRFVRNLDRQGETFFQAGRLVATTLETLAKRLKQQDFASTADLYAGSFAGHGFSISASDLGEEANHIRRGSFHAASPLSGREEAIREWRMYLHPFSHIEQLSLHLDAIERIHTDGHIETRVRLELIGILLGESRSGVDRLAFQVTWLPHDDGSLIASQCLLNGERVLCDRPCFSEVGQDAGIAFENKYYSQFLNQPLKFGMIRYGPGGITAVDYDNDGFYDLFIPDGVESKLFRNRGDGTFEDVTAAGGLQGSTG